MAAPSSSPAYAPLWLKVLVVVMGLLIVVGFIVVAAEIARRMSNPSSSSAPSGPTPSSPAAFARNIALPSGAQIVSVSPAGDRVAVHVKAADGRSTLYIVDPRNGTLLGTVDFPPGAAR